MGIAGGQAETAAFHPTQSFIGDPTNGWGRPQAAIPHRRLISGEVGGLVLRETELLKPTRDIDRHLKAYSSG